MNDVAIEDEWLRERARLVRLSMDQIRQLAGTLSAQQLHWLPPTGGWSIAQVFEHLILADTGYLAKIEALLARPAPRAQRRRAWRPSLLGGMLTRSLEPTARRKLPAPRRLRPPPPRPNVVQEYLHVRQATLRLLQRADGLELRRIRLSSPILPIIRMNLGDAFQILVVHTQRHLGQIERIRQEAAFPSA